MQLPEETDAPPQINIVPMIDAIFAVLAFFIMSTLFLTRSQGLPVTLPDAATSETQVQEQWVVTLDAQGRVFLNQAPVAVDQLAAQVRSQLTDTNPLVIIQADAATPHGLVVQVMDELRTLEGVRLAIATQRS
ncbi:MAG: biopolymer transporter ExbD [Synechococcales cyanobacterium K44_A2020_017]|jgi:biopolymer transport protein ExbD|nr:biopolymer transporter ExbD [Synechococcales cyanobacterium K32_A2020_035]MBF2095809.1 biopolymer transporter ExbD [Synechococcales cyanobacterium K44_A2020_017]